MIHEAIHHNLNELRALLQQISREEYSRPCAALSNATIGEHTRHIIEMFQCLLSQYETGIVNYDRRERNQLIQTNPTFACTQMELIKNTIDRENKTIVLQQNLDGQDIRIESNYQRELLYNLEHCIHHQALIKVALLSVSQVDVSETFGVARSTIEYRKQCAQ